MHFLFKPCQFYGGIGQLMDKESANQLIEKLEKDYSINVNLGFKNAGFKYFKKLDNGDIERVKQYSHLITIDYGRNAVWLLWLTTINGVRYSLYVNLTKQQIIWSKHRFADWLYNGTIFEGEIIEDKFFVIWDLLTHKDKVFTGNLHQRISIIRNILDHHYRPDPVIGNLTVKKRTFISYEYIRSFVDQIVLNDQNHKGILFVPVDKSTKCYTVTFRYTNQLQDKVPITLNNDELHPIDVPEEKLPKTHEFQSQEQSFWLSRIPGQLDNYMIFDIKNSQLVQHELAMVGSQENSLKVQKIFNENIPKVISGISLLRFKCRFIKRFQKWEPVDLIIQ